MRFAAGRLPGVRHAIQGDFAHGSPRGQRILLEASRPGVRFTRLPADIAYDLGRRSARRHLPPTLQARLEGALGHDFSKTCVSVGGDADTLGARAFTLGEHIFFSPASFAPSTREGTRLIARTLAHVIQQREGRVDLPALQGLCIVQDDRLDLEADQVAARLLATRVFMPSFELSSRRGSAVQRMEAQNPQERQLCELFGKRLFGDPSKVKAAGSGKANADVAALNSCNLWIADAKGSDNNWTSKNNSIKKGNTPCKQLKLKLDAYLKRQITAYVPQKQSASVEDYLANRGRKSGYAELLLGVTGLTAADCLLAVTVAEGRLVGREDSFFPTTCQQVCSALDRETVVEGFARGESIRDLWRHSPELVQKLEDQLTDKLRKGGMQIWQATFRLADTESVRLLPVIDVAYYIHNPEQLYRVEGPTIPDVVEKWLEAFEGLGQPLVWRDGDVEAQVEGLDESDEGASLRDAYLAGDLSQGRLKELYEEWF